MTDLDPELLAELREAFAQEAAELLSDLMNALIKLEAAGDDDAKQELAEEVLHSLHSLKGNGRAAGFLKVEALCQAFESALLSLRRRGMLLQPDAADLMHRCVDVLDALVSDSERDSSTFEEVLDQLEALDQRRTSNVEELRAQQSAAPGDNQSVSDSRSSTESIVVSRPRGEEVEGEKNSGGSEVKITPSKVNEKAAASIRMPIWKLDRLLREAEEMLVVKQVVEQNIEDCSDLRALAKRLNAESRRFSNLVNQKRTQGSELAEVQDFASKLGQLASTIESKISSNLRRQQQQQRECGNLVDNFLDSVKSLLMQDFSGLLSIMPKVVRDLSRELSKDIELEVFGADIEIDRRILEEIKDPLIHLVRNSLDHGIEKSDERKSNKKNPIAKLRIGAIQTGDGRVEVVVSDDGRGISASKLRAAAVREGVLSAVQAEQLSNAEAIELIYRSSFSTSEKVTEISGRGIGMAIVRDRIHELGGRIRLETEEGVGTSFRLQLPIKLSTFKGIHVIAGGLSFIVPTLNVHHAGRVRLTEIASSGSKNIVEVNGQLLAVQFLTDVLEIVSTEDRSRQTHQLLVIGTNTETTGFLVDEILQEHEVLVRPFSPPLVRVPNFIGATVLGSGKVLPVVNIADLMKSAAKAKHADMALSRELADRLRNIEHVSASVVYIIDRPTTSRVMVKSFLEEEGYQVQVFDDVDAALSEPITQKPVLILKSTSSKLDVMAELEEFCPIEQALGDTPVLLFGSTVDSRSHEFALSVGAFGYINTLEFDRDYAIKLVKQVVFKELSSV